MEKKCQNPKPKAQNPKPKAQSPKPKAQSSKPLDVSAISTILNDLRQPFKTKSVRDEEAKQGKNGPNAISRLGTPKRALTGLMTEIFELRDLVYNRVTKEDGAIRRVYKTNGATMAVTMYEVAVPRRGDTWAAGYYISDWAEDVLQFSDNESLNSSTFEGALNLDV